MRHYALVSTFAVICLFVAGNVSAELTPYYNTTPTDQCGAIDPNMGCYVGSLESNCPSTVNSYDSCLKDCDCKYNANIKKCGTNVTCKDTAAEERNACKANCVADW
jgi:hypothetical protein